MSLKYLIPFLLIVNSVYAQNSKSIHKKVDSIVKVNSFNGVILITKGSDTLYSKSMGFSDLEKRILLTKKSQFVIGSISKQITAVLIMKAFEEKQLKLTDTISKYLRIEQPWSNEVTIHQLLIHTHGIKSITEPLEFKVGSQFKYSQLGYDLLAKILEKITSKSFLELSTNLFKEHSLESTFHPENKSYKNLVKGYQNINGELVFKENSLRNFAAAGSFISNVEDLEKWNKLLHNNELVSKESLELMKINYATRIHPIFEKVDYGYGLLFNEGEQNIEIGALGYAPGFVSACYYYPKKGINLIVLENIAQNLPDFKKTFKVHTHLMKVIKRMN